MKRIIPILSLLLISFTVFAQKLKPEIKAGTTLYSLASVGGQEFPLLLTIKNAENPLTIGWSVDGYGEGWFTMTTKAVDSAVKMLEVRQPALGETKLTDSETFGIISKVAFQALVKSKEFAYDNQKFKLVSPDQNAIKINGVELDAFHVINEKGNVELWILNNSLYPLVVQSKGLPTDMIVKEIK